MDALCAVKAVARPRHAGKATALQKLQEHGSEMNAKNKPNGHGPLRARSRANGSAMSLSGMGRAASDDASELSVANATAVSAAAGAERHAYADVAPAEGGGERLVMEKAHAASQSLTQKDSEKEKESGAAKDPRPIPPGSEALPIDGEAFVDAVHSRVDLVLLEERLLNSKDEKVAQRELAYLRELRYGKHGPPSDDGPPQIIVDIPGPERDTP